MSRAADLYSKLEAEGMAALDEILGNAELESYFLEFKTQENPEAKTGLGANDRKSLSRALAGFANGDGGLVIWGVKCKSEHRQAEFAAKAPLTDAKLFNHLLQSAVSGETRPKVIGVRSMSLTDGESPQGYVVMLVPPASNPPIQAVRGEQYLIRIGSNFENIPPSILGGMFGRQPLPKMSFNVVGDPVYYNEGFMTLSYRFFLVNLGSTLAERMYITVQHPEIRRDMLRIHPIQANYDVRTTPMRVFSFVANEGSVLPPGAVDEVFRLDVIVSEVDGTIELEVAVGAQGAPPEYSSFVLDGEKIQKAIIKKQVGRSVYASDVLEVVRPR